MASLISEKRREELELIQKQLRELDNTIQEVLDDKSSMKQFAEKYGVTAQTLNNTINKGFVTLLDKVKIANSDDAFQILIDSMTPSENLIHAIFGINPKNNSITILDIVEEEKLLEIMQKSLTAREYTVIKYRFGFDCRALTLAEIGSMLNVSGDRVRQIEGKALRKLRSPSKLKLLLPNYNLRIQALMEHKEMIKLENDLSETESIELNTNRVTQNVLNINIINLELSTRTYNALSRAGFRTVGDLSKHSLEDLMRVRNLGRLSLKEVIDKLDSNEVSIDNPSVKTLKLSRTSASKLRYMGVTSIKQLSNITTSDLLSHMHCKYVKEIAVELEENYGVKLIDSIGILNDYNNDQVIEFIKETPTLFKHDYEEKAAIEILRLPVDINIVLFKSGIDTIDKLVKAGPDLTEITKLKSIDIEWIKNAVFNRYRGTFTIN